MRIFEFGMLSTVWWFDFFSPEGKVLQNMSIYCLWLPQAQTKNNGNRINHDFAKHVPPPKAAPGVFGPSTEQSEWPKVALLSASKGPGPKGPPEQSQVARKVAQGGPFWPKVAQSGPFEPQKVPGATRDFFSKILCSQIKRKEKAERRLSASVLFCVFSGN